jgi:hypothetical protein
MGPAGFYSRTAPLFSFKHHECMKNKRLETCVSGYICIPLICSACYMSECVVTNVSLRPPFTIGADISLHSNDCLLTITCPIAALSKKCVRSLVLFEQNHLCEHDPYTEISEAHGGALCLFRIVRAHNVCYGAIFGVGFGCVHIFLTKTTGAQSSRRARARACTCRTRVYILVCVRVRIDSPPFGRPVAP